VVRWEKTFILIIRGRRMAEMDRRGFLRLAALGATAAAAGAAEVGAAKVETGSRCMPREDCSGPRLEVSPDNLAWNLKQVRSMAGGRPIMAVVKANAYGLGLTEVSRFLEGQGADALAVADACSAIALREAGVKCMVLNLGPFSKEEAEAMVELGISQSVYAPGFEALAEAAKRQGKRAAVHVKIDTGLGRLGVPYYQALPFIRGLAASSEIQIEGVFTTFTEEPEFDKEQLRRFLEVIGAAEGEGITLGLRHAAGSAAVLDFPEAHLDMVRPGIALYGYYPSERAHRERKIELRPAMTLKAPVLYVKTLRPGDGVSYHRAFKAEKATRVATTGIGYSDGLPQALAGKGEVLMRGKRFPLIAAVTANHVSADLLGDEEVTTGDEAVLIGTQGDEEITAEAVAEQAGISVYKLIIGMSPLLPRKYMSFEP
jgi:alanine racemase